MVVEAVVVESHAAVVDAEVVEGSGHHEGVVELLGQGELLAVGLDGVSVSAGRLVAMAQFGEVCHLPMSVAYPSKPLHKGKQGVGVLGVVVGGVEHQSLPIRVGERRWLLSTS